MMIFKSQVSSPKSYRYNKSHRYNKVTRSTKPTKILELFSNYHMLELPRPHSLLKKFTSRRH